MNVNPPTGNGLFEMIDKVEFKNDQTLQYRVKEKDGKFKIEINTIHPSYKHVEEIDDFLSKHIESGKEMPDRILFKIMT